MATRVRTREMQSEKNGVYFSRLNKRASRDESVSAAVFVRRNADVFAENR
jgi:hypothetical protein